MEASYGILWRQAGEERPARVVILADSLELRPLEHEFEPYGVPFCDIEWLEVRPPVNGTGRERIVVKPEGRDEFEMESAVARWIVHDLSERVLNDAYRRGNDDAPAWHPGLGL